MQFLPLAFRRLAVFLFLLPAFTLHAEKFHPAAVVPGVSFGYIFGAGISIGAEVNYTPFVFNTGNGKTATGIYGSLNYFYSKGEIYKETWYHTFSCGALAFSDARFMFKAGMTKTVLRWGRGKINKKKSLHRSLDLDVSYSPLANGMFVGYRLYFPGDACFGLDIDTVHLLYAAYRFNADPSLFKTTAE